MILDRACFGDPGEIMRGVSHYIEAIVNPNWSALTPLYITALLSSRPGTRLWAAHGLVRLRDPAAIPALEVAINDNVSDVREWAIVALENAQAEQIEQ